MNQSIIKSIRSLPALDSTVAEVQKICTDPNSDVAELASIIGKDPMLTANILRYANSPLYGFSHKIDNVARAVGLFGMATVRGFVLRETINRSFDINLDPYNITQSNFNTICTTQNAIAFRWYSQKADQNALNTLSLASLVMEIGKIIIAKTLIEASKAEEFSRALSSIKDPVKLSEFEREMIGMSNEEVAARVFEQWNLESVLVQAIEFSSNPAVAPEPAKELCAALLAVKSSANIFGILSDENMERAAAVLGEFELDEMRFNGVIEGIRQTGN